MRTFNVNCLYQYVAFGWASSCQLFVLTICISVESPGVSDVVYKCCILILHVVARLLVIEIRDH